VIERQGDKEAPFADDPARGDGDVSPCPLLSVREKRFTRLQLGEEPLAVLALVTEILLSG
jgi:hypothetical protein